MSAEDAYILSQPFAPAPPARFEMPFHYLLYAEEGIVTLEAEGRRWLLPPARAALIAAGHPIMVAVTSRVLACSALIAPGFAAPPPAGLSVFEMTPLARNLLAALRHVDADTALDDDTRALFLALRSVIWRLSTRPSPVVMPVPRSELLRRALDLTVESLADEVSFAGLAERLAVTPRTLARRFMNEIGMTWGDARRRLRMGRALELLVDVDRPVGEVSLLVGYTSQSAFNAAFRAFAGQSPSGFRAAVRTPHLTEPKDP
jgi:AraC-like DNA-binding protein